MSIPALRVADVASKATSEMTVDELKAELYCLVGDTVRNLKRMAELVVALEAKGADLEGMRLSMLRELRLIGHGQVLPQVVARFGGKQVLFDQIKALPLPDQERLASEEGGLVPLVVVGGDGGLTHRMVDPRDLRKRQINQVFDDGTIRTEGQQAVWLERDRMEARRGRPSSVGKMKLDPVAKTGRCGKYVWTLDDFKAMVKALEK